MLDYQRFGKIIGVYEKLWLEGVLFPTRDKNSFNFIKYDGPVSPIMITLKEGAVYEEPNKEIALIKLKNSESVFREEIINKEQEEVKGEIILEIEKKLQQYSLIT